jgi:cell division protein FtsN
LVEPHAEKDIERVNGHDDREEAEDFDSMVRASARHDVALPAEINCRKNISRCGEESRSRVARFAKAHAFPARLAGRRVARSGMPKSTSLPYHAPFRYSRPAKDLQATFGAQTGNPQIITEENSSARKATPAEKKRASANTAKPGKATKPKASKAAAPAPAPSKAKPRKAAASKAKAKAKKAAGKR